jgi:hypothetical protein
MSRRSDGGGGGGGASARASARCARAGGTLGELDRIDQAGSAARGHWQGRRYHGAPTWATAPPVAAVGRDVRGRRRDGARGARGARVESAVESVRAGVRPVVGGGDSGTVVAGAPLASAPAAESTQAWMSSRWRMLSESRRAAAVVVGRAATDGGGGGAARLGGGATTPASCAPSARAARVVAIAMTSVEGTRMYRRCARDVPPTAASAAMRSCRATRAPSSLGRVWLLCHTCGLSPVAPTPTPERPNVRRRVPSPCAGGTCGVHPADPNAAYVLLPRRAFVVCASGRLPRPSRAARPPHP